MKNPKQEYSATYVEYTKDESPSRTYYPPKQCVKGKVRDLMVFWGRMNCPSKNNHFTIDLYERLSSKRFSANIALATLTNQHLGSIVPQEGDSFWLWRWKEERIGKGIVERLHIEVESRILTEEERAKLFELAMELEPENGNA